MSETTGQVDSEATEEFYRREFTAYNPAGSVGITCNGRGQICGISLDEDALTTDEELAAEIVALAKLARAKYRIAGTGTKRRTPGHSAEGGNQRGVP